jgi:hypothetical protein
MERRVPHGPRERRGSPHGREPRRAGRGHEWFHKYGYKLNVGYAHEEGYSEHSTIRQLANSDSFGELAYDVY